MTNKKEPTRYSMSTGLPHTENDEEVKKYPLESAEKSFLKFIEDQKESRKLYQERLDKIHKALDKEG
jgi:hypothetical protein